MNNDALDPIRHLYGEETPAETPTPDGRPSAEYALLADTKSVLDRMPSSAPDASVLNAIAAVAADHTFRPLLQAYGETEGTAPDGVEQALLASTKAVLDQMPRVSPDPSVVDAVKAAAAANTMAPLLHAYGEGEKAAPEGTEQALLASTKAVLETQPRLRPDASVLAAVSAMAAEHALVPLRHAYGEDVTPEGAQDVETALLASTRSVLEQQPRVRPDASVLAAIATAAGAGAVGTRAADRPAEPHRSRRWGVWVGSAAALVLVALSGVWALQNGPAADLQLAAEAPSEIESESGDARADIALEESESLFNDESFAVATPPTGQPTLAPERRAALEQAAPVAAAPVPSGVRAAQSQDGVARERQAASAFDEEASGNAAGFAEDRAMTRDELAGAAVGEALPVAARWDAGEDVRVLSLRLQQLAESNEGLDWDDPVVPLGASEAGAADPGIQSVRDGAKPSRVEARMRSAAPVRSSGQ